MRSSSLTPSSNSWLPTPSMSVPHKFTASTVCPGPVATRALLPVGGSRLPCRSLNASSCTYVSLSLFFGPFAATALGATMSAATRRASTTFNLVIFSPDVVCFPPARRPLPRSSTVLHPWGRQGQPRRPRRSLLFLQLRDEAL